MFLLLSATLYLAISLVVIVAIDRIVAHLYRSPSKPLSGPLSGALRPVKLGKTVIDRASL